ncbi:MAG: ABC transporter permease [Candidatus Omnitrophica bacterium]|nr:ABC transporter permease [Candidatus Omnitrophota bacterium]
MRLEFLISWRYLITKRKEKFISLISIISIFGIAIGVMALIVVIGVMNGFDIDLREKIVGNYSHITVTSFDGLDTDKYDSILKLAGPNPRVKGISPYLQGQVLVKENERFFAVGMRGIRPLTEPQVTKLRDYILAGSLDALDQEGIILGKELARYLGLGINSEFLVYSPSGEEYPLKVVGIFASGMYEYDMNLVFTDLETAQSILGQPQQLSAIAVKLDNLYSADSVKKELSALLGPSYNIKTWIETNRNFFAALELEKLAMFIILTLIILVASFNIISTLIVMVVQKTKDIGILKAQGMASAGIRRIFVLQGLIIGSLGTITGTASGIGLCGLLKKYQFIKLPSDIYYLDTLPVSIQWWPDIVLIVASAMAIVLVSTLYPAHKAAGFKPVEALRYE